MVGEYPMQASLPGNDLAAPSLVHAGNDVTQERTREAKQGDVHKRLRGGRPKKRMQIAGDMGDQFAPFQCRGSHLDDRPR